MMLFLIAAPDSKEKFFFVGAGNNNCLYPHLSLWAGPDWVGRTNHPLQLWIVSEGLPLHCVCVITATKGAAPVNESIVLLVLQDFRMSHLLLFFSFLFFWLCFTNINTVVIICGLWYLCFTKCFLCFYPSDLVVEQWLTLLPHIRR